MILTMTLIRIRMIKRERLALLLLVCWATLQQQVWEVHRWCVIAYSCPPVPTPRAWKDVVKHAGCSAAQVKNRLVGSGNLMISESDCVLLYKRIKASFQIRIFSYILYILKGTWWPKCLVSCDNKTGVLFQFLFIFNLEKKLFCSLQEVLKKRRKNIILL